MTSALIAGTLGLAASANAATVLIDYDFQTMTADTTTADTITYTGAHVDGTELMITAVSFSNYVTNAGGDIKSTGGNGLSVKGGAGGNQRHNLISYSATPSANNDPGAYETITISFDADVILNFGGDTGSWTINRAGATEAMRVVSSEAGAPTDTGVDDAAAHSFVDITTLAAGETLTFTPYGVTGGVEDLDVSSIVGLGSLSVYTESNPVPEPTTTALLGLGGLALILRRRK